MSKKNKENENRNEHKLTVNDLHNIALLCRAHYGNNVANDLDKECTDIPESLNRDLVHYVDLHISYIELENKKRNISKSEFKLFNAKSIYSQRSLWDPNLKPMYTEAKPPAVSSARFRFSDP